MIRLAVLDDWQGVARSIVSWQPLEGRAEIVFFDGAFESEEDAALALAPFDIVLAMRERTAFPATLIDRLPRLKMIALTGARSWTLDAAACTARGIVVSRTGGERAVSATAELALGLMLAAARAIPVADASMRDGRFQQGVPAGVILEGRTLGVIGLGKIGSRMARYGQALGMEVLAWSQNMTEEAAAAAGARRVERDELLARSDAVSLHVVLSERTRGILGARELALMKPGAILVNTSRGPLVDEAALVAALREERIVAGLDVFDREPLRADHPLRTLPGAVLTPHQGYGVREVYSQFFAESVENVAAFLDGKPARLLNPEVLGRKG